MDNNTNTTNTTNRTTQVESNIVGHWKSRLAIALIMLALTFIGVVIVWVEPLDAKSSWHYWIIIAITFASMNIGYGIYLRQKDLSHEGRNIWQDIVIWIGVMLSFYVLHVIIHAGIIGRLEGGIVIINTLALGVYASGVIMDPIFVLVGITMFIFAIAMAILTKYMAVIVVAIGIVASISAIYLARHKVARKKSVEQNK